MRRSAEHETLVILGDGLCRGWPVGRTLRLAAATCASPALAAGLLRGVARAEAGEPLQAVLSEAGLSRSVCEAASGAAGDGGGQAGRVLQAIGQGARARWGLGRAIGLALLYPLFVVLAAASGGVFVVHQVLPLVRQWQLEALGQLPRTSTAVVALELVLGPPGGLALLGLIIGVFVLWRRGDLSPRTPLLGPLHLSARAHLLLALAASLDSGRSLAEALAALGDACPRGGKGALRQALAGATQGASPTDALVGAGLVPAAWRSTLCAAEGVQGGAPSSSGDGDPFARALDGVGRTLALEAQLGAAGQKVWILTSATVVAGVLVLAVSLALFGGLTWS